MKNVFIINKKDHDFSEAANWGKVCYMSVGNINVFQVDRVIKDFKNQLEHSDPQDFLVPSGAIPLNMLATAIMLERHGKVNLLIFDIRQDMYHARTFTREDLA